MQACRDKQITLATILQILLAIVLVTSLSKTAFAEQCPPEAPRQPPHALTGETCPDIGRMGDIKLEIPKHYILGPDFVYEGVDIWDYKSYKNRPKVQSFDLPIRYFSIRVRLADFKPIETEQDKTEYDSWLGSGWRTLPVAKQWILVQFYHRSEKNAQQNLDLSLNLYVGDHYPDGSVFKKEDSIGELDHYVRSNDQSNSDVKPNEIFLEAKTHDTLISCENVITPAPIAANIVHCEHDFFIDGGNVWVNVGLIRDKDYYVAHWKDIETHLRHLFLSFAVK